MLGIVAGNFSITIGLHLIFALSLYLFVIVMMSLLQLFECISRCMLFANNILLVNETRIGVMPSWSYENQY